MAGFFDRDRDLVTQRVVLTMANRMLVDHPETHEDCAKWEEIANLLVFTVSKWDDLGTPEWIRTHVADVARVYQESLC